MRRWGKVQRLSHWAGFGPPENLTPMEAADLVALRIGERDALRALAVAYTRSRYGREAAHDEGEEEALRLDQHYGNIGRRLWREVFARVLRLGRVAQPPERARHTYAGARQ